MGNLTRRLRLVANLAIACLFAGCASYNVQSTRRLAQDEDVNQLVMTEELDSIRVSVVLLRQEEVSKRYLGIDPETDEMVPVYVEVTNLTNSPIRIDVARASLTGSRGAVFPTMNMDDAVARARRSEAHSPAVAVPLAVGLGIPGAVAGFLMSSRTEKANRAVENDYWQKEFRPTLLNAGGEAKGILFFDVPKESQEDLAKATIQVVNLASKTETAIPVVLPR